MKYPSVRRFRLALTIVLLALSFLLLHNSWAVGQAAQDSQAEALALDEKIIVEAKTGSEIIANLTYLCDQIGPRLTGSKNLKKANDWTAEKMKAYGLTNVHLEPWSMPEGWERGPVHARLVEPDTGVTLSMASWAWRHGTEGKIEGPVIALDATSVKELEKYRGKLKGAIILGGPPRKLLPLEQVDKAPGEVTSAYLPDALGKKSYGEMQEFSKERESFLVKEGAVALLHDAAKHFGLLFTRGGFGAKDRPSAFNKLPTLSVAHHQYEMLYRLATGSPGVKPRIELEVQNKFIPGPIAVYNTIGEIRGSEKSNEYVVVGGHLDSWDLGQGALDNGTGSCVVLETARILTKLGIKPKRTIRFALFTGEEQGLHGSKSYLAKHKEEQPRISACLVHDTGTGKVHGIGVSHRPALKLILETELVSLKKVGVTNLIAKFSGGSDHIPFEDEGIPGLPLEQEIAGYRFGHHSQADTLDRAIEANLIQGAQVMAITALRIANLDQMLPRKKK